MEFNYMQNQGWVCPKCGGCYSPNTMQCFHCGPNEQKQTVATPGTYPPPGFSGDWSPVPTTTTGTEPYFTGTLSSTAPYNVTGSPRPLYEDPTKPPRIRSAFVTGLSVEDCKPQNGKSHDDKASY